MEETRRRKEADYINAVAERNAAAETLDRLSENALAAYEGKYFSIRRVEGFLYDGRAARLDLYKNGVYCGTLSGPYDARMYPHEVEKKELFGDTWKERYWESELPSFTNMRSIWNFMDESAVSDENGEYRYTCYFFEGVTEAYLGGIAEQMISRGVLTEDEILQKLEHSYGIMFGQPGGRYGYELKLDQSLVNDAELKDILEAICFHEGAFTEDTFLQARDDRLRQEQEGSPGLPLSQDFIEAMEGANHVYRIESGGLTVSIPEGMLAIQSGEAVWNLYCDLTLPYNSAEIGYITIERLNDAMDAETAIARFADGHYDAAMLQDLGDRHFFTYTYEVAVFSETQAAKVRSRIDGWRDIPQKRVRTVVAGKASADVVVMDYMLTYSE